MNLTSLLAGGRKEFFSCEVYPADRVIFADGVLYTGRSRMAQFVHNAARLEATMLYGLPDDISYLAVDDDCKQAEMVGQRQVELLAEKGCVGAPFGRGSEFITSQRRTKGRKNEKEEGIRRWKMKCGIEIRDGRGRVKGPRKTWCQAKKIKDLEQRPFWIDSTQKRSEQ